MIIVLNRDAAQPMEKVSTLGTLILGTVHAFETVERPWVEGPAGTGCGHQQTSCIAPGLYRLNRRETEAKGQHWILSNPALGVYHSQEEVPPGVYARTLVLIHAANWAHELLGCIGPGKHRAITNGEWGVTDSRATMEELRGLLWELTDLQLEIVQL